MRSHTSNATHSPAAGRRVVQRLGLLTALTTSTLLLFVGPAQASKQVINYFGTPPANVSGEKGGEFNFPGAIAVNQSGAGPADQGDIYVVDKNNNRIERFSRDDHGTAEPYDDTFSFISTWGADVVSSGGTGDLGDASAKDYEVCTVASECKAGVPAGGNGTAAGNGDFGQFGAGSSAGIAIDQDSGNVYVTDSANHRVNVYEGDGTFLRSFGFDVAESGPGDLAGAAEQQKVTVKASGGKFSLLFRDQSTGATGTGIVTTGSKSVTNLNTTSGAFAVGQGFSAITNVGSGFPTGTTITKVETGKLTVSKAASKGAVAPSQLFADNLPFNASAVEVESSLNSLPTIGGAGGSVGVSRLEKSPEEFEYTIDFGGALAGTDLPALVSSAGGLTIGSGSPSGTVAESARGGVYEVCEAAAGDVCRAGGAGDGVGELGINLLSTSEGRVDRSAGGIAVSQPDGNPATGSVFLADTGNHRVNSYDLDGTSPSSIGSAAVFDCNCPRPTQVAVDSRGIVYASNQKNNNEIERYDTENANGGGVGFLAPIPAGVNEKQQVTVSATAGTFKLCFEGPCTADLPFGATASQVRSALEALPAIPDNGEYVQVSGGPGDATGSNPYKVTFEGQLGAKDVPQILCEDGATPLGGGSGCSVATTTPGQPGLLPTTDNLLGGSNGLAVEPDSDGPGPDTDVLYVLRAATGTPLVQQFGPLNSPGLTVPPSPDDDRHGGLSSLKFNASGLALDEATGLLYVSDEGAGGQNAHGVYALFNAGSSFPTASIDSIDQITARSALVHATIDPNGPPDLTYRLEYSPDGISWKSTTKVVLGSQETPQAVEVPLQLLEPGTSYQVRLIAQRPFLAPVEDEESFVTLSTAPEVETVGSPVRTATTARLEGRINPAGNASTYRFEYGSQGSCESNPCESSEAKAAGSADQIELVSEWVEELQPATTYHYRVIGESECEPIANPGHICVSEGEEMTLTTTASDAPLSHGHFPGPLGSDRAYEQVNAPDLGGNAVEGGGNAFSTDGNRGLYAVEGGTPFSDHGSNFGSLFFAERGEGAPHQGAWQTRQITPRRGELIGTKWDKTRATDDLSTLLSEDYEFTTNKANVWRFGPEVQPEELFESTPATDFDGFSGIELSADGSRAVMLTRGGELDPASPGATAKYNLYDISSGSTPKLLSLLPGNTVAVCGLPNSTALPGGESRWLSADGSRVFFASQGNGNCGSTGDPLQLYMREIAAEETKPISGPPLSGLACGAVFLRSTPDAAFIWTESRLVAEDTVPATCTVGTGESKSNGDAYRYDLGDESLECITCLVPGVAANVTNKPGDATDSGKSHAIAVSPDGSRVYFDAQTPLLPGAPKEGLYRVALPSGELAYVGPSADVKPELAHPMSPDGSTIVFGSKETGLDPLGGTDNGGTSQYYRYDDNDRSLICLSCPPHGSVPAGTAVPSVSTPGLSEDGKTVAFTTPTALLGADQNTAGAGQNPEAGTDAYEWRDGRLLLISDGLSNWPPQAGPSIKGITPSGRDVFFTESAQLTPDALDASRRLYDARIGGGFDFPAPPKPCPLEVCQGTPKGTPEEAAPGSSFFSGPGNEKPKRHSHKHKKKRPHKKQKRRHRAANHERRAQR